MLENIPDDPDSSSSSSSDDEIDGQHRSSRSKNSTIAESGSRSQLVNRFIRRGDHETSSFKEEIRENFNQFKNKFHTDNDKSAGVETEV